MYITHDELRLFRNLHGATLQQVAEKTGFSPTSILRYERGQRLIPHGFAETFYEHFSVTPNFKMDVMMLRAIVRNNKKLINN